MKALTLKLARDLTRMRGQVISIALVVAGGVMAAITMQSTLRSLVAARDEYFEQHRFPHVFAGLTRAPRTVEQQLRRLPGVLAVQTSIKQSVVLSVPGLDQPATGLLVSVPEREEPVLNRLHIRSGRYLTPGATDELLLSARFSEVNRLTPGDSLTVLLNGRERAFRIAGLALSPEFVYEADPTGGFATDEQLFGVAWVSERVLAPATNMTGAFNDVGILLAPGASEAQVIRQVDAILESYGGRGAYGRSLQTSNRVIDDEIAQNEATANILPLVFMGISAFLLYIVLLRLIALQRPQIAVLKAFGYGDLEIGVHYLLFALVAGLAGGALGVGLGRWLGTGYTGLYADVFRFPVLEHRTSWTVGAAAVGLSLVACLTGAVGAVRAAVRLQPADAMRGPPVARYRPLLVERLRIAHFFSTTQRMILRNLERRPIRALFSMLGIGLALSVMLVGLSMLDSVRAMIDLQYRLLQREDVTVIFEQTRAPAAIAELARTPGVNAAESYRVVPIRISHGHRSSLLGLTGLPAAGTMRPLRTAKKQPRTPPADGIALTDRVAERLHIRVGDVVTLQPLEQAHRKYQVRVVTLVDEIMGINAYMELGALGRLLQEPPVVSGAYLRLQPRSEASVLTALRELPGVRGVVSKNAMLRTFNDQLARTLAITMGILTILAAVLGVGVVYNGARIALSERATELASLRVLGFTSREVGWMLLGEQALLTFSGIPLGWVIGYGVAAIVVSAFDTQMFRVPLVVSAGSLAWASASTLSIAAAAGFLVRRRLVRADPVTVLKTRE